MFGVLALVLGINIMCTKRPTVFSGVLTIIFGIYPVLMQIFDLTGTGLERFESININDLCLLTEFSLLSGLSFITIAVGIFTIISAVLKTKRLGLLAFWFIPLIPLIVNAIVYLIIYFIKEFEGFDEIFFYLYAIRNGATYVFMLLMVGLGLSSIGKSANLYNKAVSCEQIIENKELPKPIENVNVHVQRPIHKNLSQPICAPDPVYSKSTEAQITEDIIRYKKLLDDGAITQEEYNAKKKQLLGL